MAKDRSGYIFQDKKGNWYARLTVTDVSGKRRNIKRRAQDKTKAREILKDIARQIEVEGSKFVDSARMTFSDLADYYEKHYLNPAEYVDGRKVSGLRDTDRAENAVNHFRACFGNCKLREISYEQISAYRSERLKTPTRYERPRMLASMNRELAVLRRILNIALQQGWITKNPFNSGDPLISVANERRRDRILTADEEQRLLDACHHPQRRHLRPLLICLLDTGARKSEMLKLCWRNVCFVSRLITFEGMTTKTLKTRQVAMTNRVLEELKLLRESSDNDGNSSVFGISDNVRKSFASACKIAGIRQGTIDGITLHSLRHTAATRLVKGQLPIELVGRILGHTQINTTYRYLTANDETLYQAASILESIQKAN